MSRYLSLAAAFLFLAAFCTTILAQGVAAPFTARLQVYATGLEQPILIRNARDGSKRMFVVQQAGLIRYTRGRIAVLDRSGLEQRVCECYEVVQREYRRLLSPSGLSTPVHRFDGLFQRG